MKVGVPRELKDNEYRVAITPAGVREFVVHGHEVLIEQNAGRGSSILDSEFERAGAVIVPNADVVFAEADMVLKVKEPIEEEFHRLPRRAHPVHLPAPRRVREGDRGPDPVEDDRGRVRDGREPGWVSAVARSHERGRRPHGAAGGSAFPGARERGPGDPHGRGVRRCSRQGRRHRSRHVRNERGLDSAGDGGRGHHPRHEHREASRGRPHPQGTHPDAHVEPARGRGDRDRRRTS